MAYTITKEFAFEAAHRLDGLPPGHKCGQDHGHSYRVLVVLETDCLNDVGFVRDYNELAALKTFIDEQLDHKHLNDVIPGNPTAEHLAAYIYRWCAARWPEVVQVGVSETARTWAYYSE